MIGVCFRACFRDDDGRASPSAIVVTTSDDTAIAGEPVAFDLLSMTIVVSDDVVECHPATGSVEYERSLSHSAMPNAIVRTVKNAGRNPILGRAIAGLRL